MTLGMIIADLIQNQSLQAYRQSQPSRVISYNPVTGLLFVVNDERDDFLATSEDESAFDWVTKY